MHSMRYVDTRHHRRNEGTMHLASAPRGSWLHREHMGVVDWPVVKSQAFVAGQAPWVHGRG